MPDAITIRNVTKTFGTKVAVRDLDLSVPEGALYGFIGPNGAGKTTTIRMIMSILFPDKGELTVLGRKSAVESKDRIGYLPEERGVYRKMKVGAFLAYVAKVKGMDPTGLRQRIDEWLERVDLPDVAKKKCEELSKGMQQKVQVVATLLPDPDLLILDEPFSGLDPVNMRLLRDLILEQHERGKTVIFSTHVMQQAESLCDHIVMIDQGRKVLDATLDEIRAQFDTRSLRFEPFQRDADLAAVRAIDSIQGVQAVNGAFEATLAEGAEPAGAIQAIAGTIPVASIELIRPTLEDVFIEIAGAKSDKERLRAALRDEGPVT